MRHLKHVLHSRAIGSGVSGSVEILRRSEMTDRLMRMRVKGRLDLRSLRALIPEPSSMRTLRSLMSEYRGSGANRGNDLDVLAWFAGQIAARRLHLVARPRETPAPVVPTQGGLSNAPMAHPTYTPTAPQVPPPPPPPQRAPAPSPPRPPTPTIAHVDQGQLPAVLEAAAREATPFSQQVQDQNAECLECAARDGSAFILSNAARNGTPFIDM